MNCPRCGNNCPRCGKYRSVHDCVGCVLLAKDAELTRLRADLAEALEARAHEEALRIELATDRDNWRAKAERRQALGGMK